MLISGRGSNMQAIANACEQNKLDAELCAVISNNPEAAGLRFAIENHIPTDVVDHRDFNSRDAFDAALADKIDQYDPQWVALAGFMRILGTDFVKRYNGRLLNIHPSLLPAYPGLNTHQRVLNAGERHHGASVHFVTAELDAGPVISQSCVEVLPDDDALRLQERVLKTEHSLYVQALALCVNGNVRLDSGECHFTQSADASSTNAVKVVSDDKVEDAVNVDGSGKATNAVTVK